MQSEINITVGQLRGLLKCASDKDVRYYLNGACMQPDKGRAVSTDGHVMLMTPAAGHGPDFIIPNDALREIVKKPRDLDAVKIVCDTVTLEGRAIRHDYRDPATIALLVDFKVIDGRFPDCDRVIPDEFTGETAHFDARLLSRLDAGIRFCLAGYGEKTEYALPLFHNGSSAGMMAHAGFPEYALGIVMPFRAPKNRDPASLVDEFRDQNAERRAAC